MGANKASGSGAEVIPVAVLRQGKGQWRTGFQGSERRVQAALGNATNADDGTLGCCNHGIAVVSDRRGRSVSDGDSHSWIGGAALVGTAEGKACRGW